MMNHHRRMHRCHGRQLGILWAEWLPVLNPTPLFYLLAIYFARSLTACPQVCTCPDPGNQVLCSAVSLTEIPRNLPPSLTTLDLTKNQIDTLSSTGLADLRSMVNLKLKDNEIETIYDGAFETLGSLQTLELGNNKLTKLTEFTFQGASGLLHLDISANQLSQVDGAFTGMTELSRLDLHDNLIEEVTQFTLRDLTNLRYLLLAGNQIKHIDRKAFKNLEKLTYLVLKGNPIGEVARFQFNSYYLSYVDLSECNLNHVPRGLPNSIRYLQLRRNNITVVRRHTFQDCPFVSILVLDENGITEINERTFEHMTYLQQLWLNNNHLRRIPHNLPTTLQRLLMDQNVVQYVNDVFPVGSQLSTLSLMGNNVSYLSYSALYKTPLLQSLDLSNNQLEHIYGHTFLNSSKVETLQLSKNPLQYFHSRSFQGLTGLQTLSLAYIPTVVSIHSDSFDDLKTLTKLDLDSSHWIIRTILENEQLLSKLKSLIDLSMQSSDIVTLRQDFLDFLPDLGILHLSSARWLCDTNLIWLRDWLLTTKVRVENKDDITCYTPHELNGRSITSLQEHEFAAATTPKSTTLLPTPPGRLSTFPSTLSPPTTTITPPTTTMSTPPYTEGEHTTEGTTSTTTEEDEYYEEYYEEYDKDSSALDAEYKPVEPFDLDSLYEEVYGVEGDAQQGSSSKYPSWDELLQATLTSTQSPANYDPNGVEGDNLEIRPLSGSGPEGETSQPNPAKNREKTAQSSSTLIIIIATTIATLIIAGVLIFVIVYLSRKNRGRNQRRNKDKPSPKTKPPRKKKEVYQNGIKYKSRNDVLYFMPKNTEGSTSDSLQTTASQKEAMSLVPGRDINHEGPLRVYKWEDF